MNSSGSPPFPRQPKRRRYIRDAGRDRAGDEGNPKMSSSKSQGFPFRFEGRSPEGEKTTGIRTSGGFPVLLELLHRFQNPQTYPFFHRLPNREVDFIAEKVNGVVEPTDVRVQGFLQGMPHLLIGIPGNISKEFWGVLSNSPC